MTRSKAYNSLTFATIIFSSISFSIAFHSWKLSPFKKEQSISLYSSVTPERVEHIAVGRASSSLDLDYTFHTVINKEARSASGIYNSKFSDRDRHSASDWLHNMQTLPQSSVLRNIRSPVLAITLWSTIVSVIHRLLLATGKAGIASNMCIISSPHSFLVRSLGLLLVFRTNTAYQRFVEGRAIWERIQSTSRNLSRFIFLYEQELGKSRVERLQYLLAAFPYLLRHHIRPRCNGNGLEESQKFKYGLLLQEDPFFPVETRYEGDKAARQNASCASKVNCWVDKRKLPWCLMPEYILERIASCNNRPLWICDHMAKEVASLSCTTEGWSVRDRLQFISKVEALSKSIGECERIHCTAVPLNYARHSLRSLTLWLFTLPFTLIKDLGLLTGPAMGVVAWLLFGVYEIGYSIEDPFLGSLRLSILCDNIRQDVLGTRGNNDHNSAFFLPPEEDTTRLSSWEKTHTVAESNFKKALELVSVPIEHIGIFNSSTTDPLFAM